MNRDKPHHMACPLIVACLLLTARVAEIRAEMPEEAGGVVVEKVSESSALWKAGIRPADLLFGWQSSSSPPERPETMRGDIGSAFDWMWLVMEQVPRGVVLLTGRRGIQQRVFEVAAGPWEAEVRPRGEESPLLECWKWFRLGDQRAEQRAWPEALEAYQKALETTSEAFANSVVWRAVGDAHMGQNELEAARQAYHSARELRERAWGPENLSVADILNRLGELAWTRGDLKQTDELHRRALEIREKLAPGSLALATSANNLGLLAGRLGDLERAEQLHQRALAIRSELAPGSSDVAQSLNNLGLVAYYRGDLGRATQHWQRTLAILRSLEGESLPVAYVLNNLGGIAEKRGDLDAAQAFHRDALEVLQELEPDSLSVANSLNNLGLVAAGRGALDHAWSFYHRALAIRRRLAPGSLGVAASLSNLGSLAHRLGDLDQASQWLEESLKIKQRLAPQSSGTAASLHNLASVFSDRGHLERSTELFERAFEIWQALAPESLDMASTLDSFGNVALKRQDPLKATDLFLRSAEIKRRLAPGSLDLASTLNNLAAAHAESGNLDRAELFYKASLDIKRKQAPGSLNEAISLDNLGNLYWLREDLEVAQDYHRRGLEIKQQLAPESLPAASSLYNLAEVLEAGGELEEAEALFRRALAIWEESSPDSVRTATALHTLGLLQLRKQPPRLKAAEELLGRAVDQLEDQLSHLGGAHDVRAGFRARYHAYYRDALGVQLSLGRPDAAFHTLERSRARGFLEQLAERDTVFSADVPEPLDRKRRQVAVRHDRVRQRLDRREGEASAEELLEQLRRLRDEARGVEEEIRRASPKLADLHYPRPLEIDAVRAALDPGTLLLAYSVAETSTHLFVTARDQPLEVHSLAVSEEDLRRHVRELGEQTHRQGWPKRSASRLAKAKLLYELLIGPAGDRLERCERLLLVPDGPLHLLPFASLVREGNEGAQPSWQYLVEWKPLHSVLSATVYAQLKAARPRSPGVSEARVAAFGDPLLHGHGPAQTGFRPLLHTRQEVRAIATHYPGTRAYLGADATEELVTSIDRDVAILHFATHATLDHRFPLSSALVLARPEKIAEGRDNGLLQAWEIFERMRLDADLVVLSACSTGLGQELGGEGLIGLTRAFQYAGGRTVAATLWQVADQTTAVLMERFYAHLRSGKPKDEALRAAQIELIHRVVKVADENDRTNASAPYYWAAFQLYGDWR